MTKIAKTLSAAIVVVVSLGVSGASISVNHLTSSPKRILGPAKPPEFVIAGSEKRVIALTFDDGPYEEQTPRVLDILARYGVKATFFLVGRNVKENPDLVRRMLEEGHEIGNHTQEHLRLDCRGDAEVHKAIRDCSSAIKAATGREPALFRPPGGRADTRAIKAAQELGMKTVHWSVNPIDYRLESSEKLARSVIYSAEPGAIVLLHDKAPVLLEALPGILARLKEKGYDFVTASQLGASFDATKVPTEWSSSRSVVSALRAPSRLPSR